MNPSIWSRGRSVLGRLEFWGLVLRVALMSIGACWDLHAYYWLSHRWVYHGAPPFELFGGLLRVWPLFYLHSGWLWLIRPLLGPGDYWVEGLAPTWFSNEHWMTGGILTSFYSQPHIGWTLFVLKCPYVLAELSLIWMILHHLVDGTSARKQAARFLWLNPISLYAISLYGGWDVLPVGLLLLSAVWLRRRPGWAGIVFGFAACFKVFPLILLPPFIWLGLRAWRQRLMFSVAAAGVFVLPLAMLQLMGMPSLAALLGAPHLSLVLTSNIALFGNDNLILPVLALMLVYCHMIRFGEASIEAMVRYSLAVLLVCYSFTFFHVQYFFWYVPFLAIVMAKRAGLLWLFAIQVMAYGVYTLQWGPALTTYLIAPLNPGRLILMPDPSVWLGRYVKLEHVVGVAHSLLAGASLWMAYEVLRVRQPVIDS